MLVVNGLNFLVLLFLSGLHVYWALGGQWALAGVVPTTPTGKATFSPGVVPTLLVSIGLLVGAFLHGQGLGVLNFLPFYYWRLGLLVMGSVFLLRAVGDFNYVGVFKKQKATLFAQRDRLYYTPLCLVIAMNAFLAVYLV